MEPTVENFKTQNSLLDLKHISYNLEEYLDSDTNGTINIVLSQKGAESAYLYENSAVYVIEHAKEWRERNHDKFVRLIELLSREKNNRDGSHLFDALREDTAWCDKHPDIVKNYWLSFDAENVFIFGLRNRYDKKFPKEFNNATQTLDEATKLRHFRAIHSRFDDYVEYLKKHSSLSETERLQTFSGYAKSYTAVVHGSFVQNLLKQDQQTFEAIVNSEWLHNKPERDMLIYALMNKHKSAKIEGDNESAEKIGNSLKNLYRHSREAKKYIEDRAKGDKELSSFAQQKKQTLFKAMVNRITGLKR